MQLSIYLCTFSSTCFGLTRPSSGAMDVTISLHIQHMVSLVQLGVETCRAESTQINTQLHQVGKLIHNSNQNARYNYAKEQCFKSVFSLRTQIEHVPEAHCLIFIVIFSTRRWTKPINLKIPNMTHYRHNPVELDT